MYTYKLHYATLCITVNYTYNNIKRRKINFRGDFFILTKDAKSLTF